MKSTKIHYIYLATGLALVASAMGKEEKSLTLEQIPAKAGAVISKAVGKEQVKIKAEKEDGVDAFEAKWSAGGHKHEITVTADGTVLSEEEVIALESAPAPVQAAIKALAGSGKLEAVEKETEKGATIYEAVIKTDDGKLEVKFDATGKELKRETEKKDKEEKDDDDDKEEKK